MSAAGVQTAVDKIAYALYALIEAVFEDDSVSNNIKVNRNTLADSQLRYDLYVQQLDSSNDIVLQALFNNYVVYLEWDRPPFYGKQPPIDALVDWAEKNGIDTDANTLWAISYAIWRDGHAGRPIFATIDREVDARYMGVWSDSVFEALVDNLDLYFND